MNARWAPITSLFSRLTSAPVRVRVKNATGIRCTCPNTARRRSRIRPSPIRADCHRSAMRDHGLADGDERDRDRERTTVVDDPSFTISFDDLPGEHRRGDRQHRPDDREHEEPHQPAAVRSGEGSDPAQGRAQRPAGAAGPTASRSRAPSNVRSSSPLRISLAVQVRLKSTGFAEHTTAQNGA